jgi:hypothetical protein
MCNSKNNFNDKPLQIPTTDEMKSLEEFLANTGFKIDPKDLEKFLQPLKENLPLYNNGDTSTEKL